MVEAWSWVNDLSRVRAWTWFVVVLWCVLLSAWTLAIRGISRAMKAELFSRARVASRLRCGPGSMIYLGCVRGLGLSWYFGVYC